VTAIRLDITIEQGADFDDPFVLPTPSPINLTDATAVMQVRTSITDPTALITLSTQDESLIISGNSITPFIAGSVTAAFQSGTYVYDLKILQVNGRLFRAFQGDSFVVPQVTTITPPNFNPLPGQFDFSIAGNSGLQAGVF
jgi:hypothetical protein